MKIAVEGCAHGELDNIYDTIKLLEENEKIEVDLLICCGDFQASRNEQDLNYMAVPQKYRDLCTFYKYYNGEKKAPILTIFIGGNHEASNYLQELPYGGWVAPNIYYLGYAGVINIAGVRIAGLSGIYKSNDYMKGHYEVPPYNDNSVRSVYHVRNLEIFRLKQLHEDIDIFLSHDWPTGVTDYGNVRQLVKFKPHFQKDIESDKLGNPHSEVLLNHLKPSYWFAAHLHCKFAALIPHSDEKVTKFLALDKCLPNRRFLQILDVPHDINSKKRISYDLEWLTILYMTNHLLSVKNVTHYMPGPNGTERFNFTPSKEEKEIVLTIFENNLVVPLNFEQTEPGHNITKNLSKSSGINLNPQTKQFCQKLGIDDPIELILKDQPNITVNHCIDINTTQSFINDSDILDPEYDSQTESVSIGNKSFKLNLPEPKCQDESDTNDANENIQSTASQSDVSVTNDNVENDKIVENNEVVENNEIVANNEVLTNNEVVEKMDATPNKKFKRRNANMYATGD